MNYCSQSLHPAKFVHFGRGAGNYLFSATSRPDRESVQPFMVQWEVRSVSPGVNRPEPELHHSYQ